MLEVPGWCGSGAMMSSAQCHLLSLLNRVWGEDPICIASDAMMLARAGGKGKGKVKGSCQLCQAVT